MDKRKIMNGNGKKSHFTSAATDLWHEGQRFANDLYEEGVHKVNEAQHNLRVYTDEALETVQRKPLTALIIAAGVGFVLSAIFRRK